MTDDAFYSPGRVTRAHRALASRCGRFVWITRVELWAAHRGEFGVRHNLKDGELDRPGFDTKALAVQWAEPEAGARKAAPGE